MEREQYSIADRERAVAAYVATGMFSKAAKATGIDQATIRSWHLRYPTWWEEVEAKLRKEYEAEHRAGLRDIITLGMRELHDRLEHGDAIVDKAGNEIGRKKVSARDLVIATGTMIDKLRVSLGQPTSISGKPDASNQDKLEALKTAAREQNKSATGPNESAREVGEGADKPDPATIKQSAEKGPQTLTEVH